MKKPTACLTHIKKNEEEERPACLHTCAHVHAEAVARMNYTWKQKKTRQAFYKA